MAQKLYLIVDKSEKDIVYVAQTRREARMARGPVSQEKIVELPLTTAQVQLIARATN